ncbi:MAG: hypothetical protein ACRD3J_07735, partial [Thermoanaerobaculia bacterium]
MVDVARNPSPPIHAEYAPTIGEYIRAHAGAARSSVGTVAFGTALLILGIFDLVLPQDPVASLLILAGLALMSGYYIVPFIWWSAHRRPDLLLGAHELTADVSGLRIKTATTSIEQEWSTFRDVREQPADFIMG